MATRLAGGFVDATLLPLSMPVATHPFEWLSTDSTNTVDAAGDVLHGDQGEDIILGQQGDDTIYGGTEDDDLTGGHNVVGGLDAGDRIDGGAGNDVVAGDNALDPAPRRRAEPARAAADGRDDLRRRQRRDRSPDGSVELGDGDIPSSTRPVSPSG